MLHERRTRWRPRCAAGLALAATLFVTGRATAGSTGFALTSENRLLRFDTDAPGTVSSDVSVAGLDDSEDLLGIDFRPSMPGSLYGLSSFGRLYTINTSTGAATAVGPASGPDQLPLTGRSYGVDFNPVADALRVVSDLGENYRINPNTGAVAGADGNLTYAGGDVSAGVPSDVTAAAYTNNTGSAGTTTLYEIDSAAGNLVIQAPPNDGTLRTVGSLGLDELRAQLIGGFDILGEDNRAYALSSGEAPDFGQATPATFYLVNLQSGVASAVGQFGDGTYAVRGLALSDAAGLTPNPVPLPPAVVLFPLTAAVAMVAHRRMRRTTLSS